MAIIQTQPALVAHRGYAAAYPENTLLAIRAAVEAGAAFVEFDIQLSQDHTPVLFHDRDLNRMCGRDGSVHELTLTQLKTLSVHEFGRFGYKYIGNPISTLAEVVAYLADQPQVTAFVELKRISIKQFGLPTVINAVLPLLNPIRTQCVVISYALEALQQVRAQSEYPIGAVFDDWREGKQSAIRQLRPEYVFTDIDLLPRWGKIHSEGSRVAVYECTDPDTALAVHRRGVALVETFAIAEMLLAIRLRA